MIRPSYLDDPRRQERAKYVSTLIRLGYDPLDGSKKDRSARRMKVKPLSKQNQHQNRRGWA